MAPGHRCRVAALRAVAPGVGTEMTRPTPGSRFRSTLQSYSALDGWRGCGRAGRTPRRSCCSQTVANGAENGGLWRTSAEREISGIVLFLAVDGSYSERRRTMPEWASGAVGRGFKSLRARQTYSPLPRSPRARTELFALRRRSIQEIAARRESVHAQATELRSRSPADPRPRHRARVRGGRDERLSTNDAASAASPPTPRAVWNNCLGRTRGVHHDRSRWQARHRESYVRHQDF